MVLRVAGPQAKKYPNEEFFTCLKGRNGGCGAFQSVREMKVVDGVAQWSGKGKGKKRKMMGEAVKEDESKKHLVALVEKTLVELTENRTLVIEVRKEIADVQKAIQELKEQLNGSGSGSSTMLRGIGNVATKKK
jgi:alanyl-tRNA synthetase